MSCNICEVETVLFCPHCTATAGYDTGGRECGVTRCVGCSGKFQWVADRKFLVEAVRPMATYWMPDRKRSGSDCFSEPQRVSLLNCPGCGGTMIPQNQYADPHDLKRERCPECDLKFMTICHEKLRFYTYKIGDATAELSVIKGDSGGAEAQAACM